MPATRVRSTQRIRTRTMALALAMVSLVGCSSSSGHSTASSDTPAASTVSATQTAVTDRHKACEFEITAGIDVMQEAGDFETGLTNLTQAIGYQSGIRTTAANADSWYVNMVNQQGVSAANAALRPHVSQVCTINNDALLTRGQLETIISIDSRDSAELSRIQVFSS